MRVGWVQWRIRLRVHSAVYSATNSTPHRATTRQSRSHRSAGGSQDGPPALVLASGESQRFDNIVHVEERVPNDHAATTERRHCCALRGGGWLVETPHNQGNTFIA